MDCKTTSTKPRQAGMTVVQLLVGAAIGGIVLLAVASLTVYSGRSFAALSNYVELDSYSRFALDRMTKEIRQAQSLKSYTATQLNFLDFDGADLSYIYDPQARTLTRTKAGQSQV